LPPCQPGGRRELQRDVRAELKAVRAGAPPQQLEVRVREFVRQHTAAWCERDHTERVKELDRDDADLERVARFGAFDKDRPRHRMRAWPAFGHALLNRFQSVRNLRFGGAREP
jgi:hypothetical protein